MAVDLLPQIKVTKTKENDEVVEQALLSMPAILIAPLALVWLVNRPDYQLPKQGHVVLYGTNDRVSTEALTGKGNTGLDVEMTEIPDHPKNTHFHPRILIGPTKSFQKIREMIASTPNSVVVLNDNIVVLSS